MAIDSTWSQLYLDKEMQYRTLGAAIYGSVKHTIDKIDASEKKD